MTSHNCLSNFMLCMIQSSEDKCHGRYPLPITSLQNTYNITSPLNISQLWGRKVINLQHISFPCWMSPQSYLYLLKFYVDESSSRIGNSTKSCVGKNDGGARFCRPRSWSLCSINNPDLNSFVGNTSLGRYRTNAPHQVLPPAGRTVVPNPFPCCCKQIAWWELRVITPKTSCGGVWRVVLACSANISWRRMEEVGRWKKVEE